MRPMRSWSPIGMMIAECGVGSVVLMPMGTFVVLQWWRPWSLYRLPGRLVATALFAATVVGSHHDYQQNRYNVSGLHYVCLDLSSSQGRYLWRRSNTARNSRTAGVLRFFYKRLESESRRRLSAAASSSLCKAAAASDLPVSASSLPADEAAAQSPARGPPLRLPVGRRGG